MFQAAVTADRERRYVDAASFYQAGLIKFSMYLRGKINSQNFNLHAILLQYVQYLLTMLLCTVLIYAAYYYIYL